MSKDFNIKTRKSQATENADNIINEIKSEETADDKKRINFDLPTYLFNLMEEKRKKHGFTMKGYIATLIRKDLGVD